MPGPQPRFETDPDLITRVCALIASAGYPPTLASEAEGISRQVWHNYRRRALEEQQDGDEAGRYTTVVARVEAAHALQAGKALATVHNVMATAESDRDRLKAALWLLEKQHSPDFSGKQTVAVEPASDGNSIDDIILALAAGERAIAEESTSANADLV